MNSRTIWGIVGGLAILGFAAYMIHDHESRIDLGTMQNMQFPKGAIQLVGNEEGTLCHVFMLRNGGVDEVMVPEHSILGRDFRQGTEQQKRAWIIEESARDAQARRLACTEPAPDIFSSPAFAQRYCHNCGGGDGCVTWTCPAHFQGGHCGGNGTDCAVTWACCGDGCVISC